MKRIFTTLAFAWALISNAQTVLTAGDIAILGVNNDDPDQIKFVNLVDLAAGTSIKFTDNGWNGSALATSEGTYTWTTASSVAKGTVHTINVTAMALSTSGDQVFAYQGAATSPTFIFGLSTRPWVTGSITSNTSRKPASLITATSAIAFSVERDNGKYKTVTNTGDKTTVLASIGNLSNWTTTDTRISSFPAWVFNLGGVSNEPVAQPTNMVFSNVKSYSFNLSFTAASPAPAGYLVLRTNGGIPSTDPQDGVTYNVGDVIGNARVLIAGTTTSAFLESVIANTTYGFKVYSFNGSGATMNYMQASPLTATVTTNATEEGSYFSSIDPQAPSFITDLQNRVRAPYTKVLYDNYDETMMTHFAFAESTAGKRTAICVYSGEVLEYTPPFVWLPFSREHTWCVSWTPSNATSGTNEYCDQHHLFPVNQNNANAVRNNHPLGEVTTVISTYLQGTYGLDANGNTVYEPRDSQKGDAARAMLYMSLRYNGVNGYDWTFDYLNNVTLPAAGEDPQDVNLLLSWHTQDPPDNYEIARNDYIQSIQQNRNPFVDHPDWVNAINFSNLTPAGAQMPEAVVKSVETDTEIQTDVMLYPNPVQDEMQLSLHVSDDCAAACMMFDMTGKMVFNENLNMTAGTNNYAFNMSEWTPGAYIVVVDFPESREIIRFMIQ